MPTLPELPGKDAFEQVFNFWKLFQAKPAACKLTTARRHLLKRAFAEGYTAEDLAGLVMYANRAKTDEARGWQGENSRDRTYLDLTNLLVISKVDGRIDRAGVWMDNDRGFEDGADEGVGTGVSALAALVNRAPGQPAIQSTQPDQRPATTPPTTKRRRGPRW